MASCFYFCAAFIFIFVVNCCEASLSAHFNAYLKKTFGEAFRRRMNRDDLGGGASFGGRNKAGQQLTRPVIIVHGITNKADRFLGIRDHLVRGGRKAEEIFATTWGGGGKTHLLQEDMKCAHVKQVRDFITAVRHYAGHSVDIIAFSMGSPVSRKAILGGACVDTRENLGGPLTAWVDDFVSVAGANYSASMCMFPIGGVCGGVVGLSCGSRFLNDINSRSRYEGRYIFSISSTADDKVGYTGCGGRYLSDIPGQNARFVHTSGYNHDQVMDKTLEQQKQLITRHTAAGATSRPPAPGPQSIPFVGSAIPTGRISQVTGLLSRFTGGGGGGGIPFIGRR